MGVGQPVIPLLKNLQVGGDCLLLDCKGQRVTDFILVVVPVLVVSFYLVQVLNDLVDVLPGDLIGMGNLASFSLRADRGMFTGFPQRLGGISRSIHLAETYDGGPWLPCLRGVVFLV